MKMNGNNKFSNVDGLVKQNIKNESKSKRKNPTEKIRFRMAKSEECPECIANGLVVPLNLENYKKESGGDSDTCKCAKCRPENFSHGDNTDGKGEAIAPELDSTSSRSTLKIRARSWPLLIPPGDSKKGPKEPEIGLPSPVAQVRRLLWRHYYPEGGWGYVVVTCCILVNILNHGLQLAYGILHKPISDKFNVGIRETGNTVFYILESRV